MTLGTSNPFTLSSTLCAKFATDFPAIARTKMGRFFVQMRKRRARCNAV